MPRTTRPRDPAPAAASPALRARPDGRRSARPSWPDLLDLVLQCTAGWPTGEVAIRAVRGRMANPIWPMGLLPPGWPPGEWPERAANVKVGSCMPCRHAPNEEAV